MMRRQEIRKLKRLVSRERDIDALLSLLERSIRFGHKRLALLRCIQAERLGVKVSPEVLDYCQSVADSLPKEVLHQIIKNATTSYPTH